MKRGHAIKGQGDKAHRQRPKQSAPHAVYLEKPLTHNIGTDHTGRPVQSVAIHANT